MKKARTYKVSRWMGMISALMIFTFAVHGTDHILVETESFHEKGGWVIDQQSFDIMGSSYLLAHGMGVPVPNAVTEIHVDRPGDYHVWVRTKDWAPFPKGPGKFNLVIEGKAMDKVFGSDGSDEWRWYQGGKVKLNSGSVRLELEDLTGFEGRCDAILLTMDTKFRPPNDKTSLESLRVELLDFLSETSKEKMHIVNVVGRWAANRPEELAEWIDGESGMSMEKMYRGYFQQELLHAWLGQDPGAAAEWWLSRETGGRRDLQIKELVEKWANVDLFGAAEWLASQTLDKQMDRSVWILAERMTDTDPERAFTWAASIKEDWIRERAMSRVLNRCVRTDRTAAEAAVRGADLPEEEKARLLEQMKNGEVTQ